MIVRASCTCCRWEVGHVSISSVSALSFTFSRNIHFFFFLVILLFCKLFSPISPFLWEATQNDPQNDPPQVNEKCGPGRPKMTWKQLTEGLQRRSQL